MAGHDDDSGRMPPLPVRSRPVAGESVSSYVRRLAVANHLRPSYLRGYLAGPPRYLGPIQPGRLAVLSGRTVAVLERTLTGLARHTWPAAQARPPAAPRRHTRAADKPALFAAIRRDAQDGDPIRILATRYQVHRRMIRQALADPTPPPRKQPPQRATPVLDRLRGPITTMLTTEPDLTVRQIWERLFDDHDAGISYNRVHHYVVRLRPGSTGHTPARHNPKTGKIN